MTRNDLSTEQQDLVRLALEGKNVLCDACIGSGKTSTINVLCNEFDSSKQILYLTYNRLLKLDAQQKILNDNVTVQNYHGFASKMLYRYGIKDVGQGEQISRLLEGHIPVGHYDVLIIDEYQDINEEISKMLEYVKDSNPCMQIIAVGDMKQKIYDHTSLDIWDFINKFLGKHTQVNFTQCFRLSHDLAGRLGMIWDKNINGVNAHCDVKTMTKEEVIDYLDSVNPKDVLCLGARTGPMVTVLNALEERPGNLYDKNHVYASIKDNDGDKCVAPGPDVGIFTTYDGSKGMERPICVVFDFTEFYWGTRMHMPMVRYEILRNLFCVAASRGKEEVIFVEPEKDKDFLLSDKTLMTPVKTHIEANPKFDISEMFDFKFDEDVNACYDLIKISPVFRKDVHPIEVKHSDAMIDLAPCIGIYQQANFFDYYDIDSAIAYYMYMHKDKKMAMPQSWKSVEQKVLFLTMLMTSQDRYVKQVELPIITKEQESQINKRLSVLFSPDENVQERCELNAFVDDAGVSKVVLSGMADVVKDKTVYLLKFVSALSHRHFLQCASYMLATGLQKGVIWNIYDNKLYNVEIPDRDAFLNAVVKCVTKGVYDKVYKFVLEKDYTQNLDTILDQIMTDDSLPEFDTGGNVKEEKSQDEGISIIKQGEQYVILDAANRESVDGCAANGYDSILAACEAYVRMNKKKAEETTSKKELLSNIEDWLDNHAEFERQMARISIEINRGIGPYASYSTFSTYVVRKMLKDWGLVINFSERQLLKVWKEREKKRPKPEPTRSVEDVLQEMGFAESNTPPAEVHTPAPAAPAYRVIRSSRLSKPGDVRYIVVEEESSNVLDDANGYGYKSMQAAHKGYAYKRRNGGNFSAQPKKEKAPNLTLQGEQLTFGGV